MLQNPPHKTGERFRDLKERIRNLETENVELKTKLAASICPYCNKVRGEAHSYFRGEERACPNFAYFPDQTKGINSELGRTD